MNSISNRAKAKMVAKTHKKYDLLSNYKLDYSNYCKKIKDISGKIPREAYLFDIRFRLALGLKIDFDSDIAKTKTKEVKDAYIAIYELISLWNAFEAFLSWQGIPKAFDLPKTQLYTETSKKPLEIACEKLKNLYKEKTSEFACYFKLVEEIGLNNKLKSIIKEISISLANGKNISPTDLLSLISAERNMFFHLGESAKQGMNYSPRKKILAIYNAALAEFIYLLAVQGLTISKENNQ
jgi:hypothetical protein